MRAQGVDDAALVFLLTVAHCRAMWPPNAFLARHPDPPSVAWAHEIAADVAKYIGAVGGGGVSRERVVRVCVLRATA